MKKILLGVGLTFIFSGLCLAQKVDSKTSSTTTSKTSVSKNGGDVVLQSGTQIAGQLQNSLDAQKAQVGDQVVLKTTKAIKQNGQVVVEKGSRLIGRVTEVQQKGKGNATSKVGILFDRLEQGKTSLPIDAAIVSLTQVRANVKNEVDSDVSGNSSTRTTTKNSNDGGLLGGVTNTVGGVVNTTTQTVGDATSTAGQTVNGATGTVGGIVKGVQVSTGASAEGGSMLSLQGGNLRLEKGTTFNLRLNASASTNDK